MLNHGPLPVYHEWSTMNGAEDRFNLSLSAEPLHEYVRESLAREEESNLPEAPSYLILRRVERQAQKRQATTGVDGGTTSSLKDRCWMKSA